MRNDILKIIEDAKSKHNNKNSLFLEKYLSYYHQCVQDNIILYESFNGAGMIDNPYGIFKAFEKRSDFEDYIHIWVISNYDKEWFNIIQYSQYKNIKFIIYGSDDYLYYLSVAKYLINNCTFPPYFTKKEEQIYINTWHGITNKYLGYDVPNSNMDMGNTIRNFLSCDYIIAANTFMTDVYKRAYKLDGLWCGEYIECGQPRNDLICVDKEYVIKKLLSYGINIDVNKKIILYAPTWSGTLSHPDRIDFDEVRKALNINGYQVLIKAHHVNYDKMHQYVPSGVDTNELLSICDILVTDYSSIYYDWLLLNKPIIFYAPNYDKYIKEHGLYFNFPFLYAENLSMLHTMISHIDTFFNQTKYILQQENEKHNMYKFNAGENVLHAIFDGDRTYIHQNNYNKKKLLFYTGDFKSNGVTTSFSSLINNIDYDKYDVSVIVLKKNDNKYIDYVNSLNKNVRVLCRAGTYAQTLLEACANAIVLNNGIASEYLDRLLPRQMYQREFRRCFGNTKFDTLINFTGYSPFYGFFFMCNDGEKIIWQHNDMVRDQNREENGKKPLYDTLKVIFTMYPYYDKLVSASKEIMFTNMRYFSNINRNKFLYAHNTLDYNKIISLSSVYNCINVNQNHVNFVNNSRLSYAKNHVNLIRAFHKLREKYDNVDLYLIGDGNLKEELMREANGADYIHIAGYNSNPFYTMRQCDCFVFPSLYEGQGLSLIEARTLNLPIIVSPLPKMKGIILEHGQYLLDGFDVDDIYHGLCMYMEHPNDNKYVFNAKRYNACAYKEFEFVIEKGI